MEIEHTLEQTMGQRRNNKGRYQKRKLQANIHDKHRCKNPQQNTSKLNSKA